MTPPVIGLTANVDGDDYTVRQRYCQQLVAAGALPVLLPPATADDDSADALLDTLDAIIFTGGGDHDPSAFGELPDPSLSHVDPQRDAAEFALCRFAHHRALPMLGICRGMQTMAIALGGHVKQDISRNTPRGGGTPRSCGVDEPSPVAVQHSQTEPRPVATHAVSIAPGTILAQLYGESAMVNSFHHQAVDNPGPCFRAIATADDGTLEAMQSAQHLPQLAVQWHPEWLAEQGAPIFRWLVAEAQLYQRARRFHDTHLALDSHCDTPMLFAQGADLRCRNTSTLVDLPKMHAGHLAAVTLAAYLPQSMETATSPARGKNATSPACVPPPATPRAYADHIFDTIEAQCPDAIARCPDDVRRLHAQRQPAFILAIENGIALEGDISAVEHFAGRGVSYITLCHNGDNALCGSAKGAGPHRGLTELGASVVQQMNASGILVDLSHASRDSFYDALAASRTPIVCSHSNCRALCDSPRNLDDDQLRALAQAGGVAHTTLYHGFLSTAAEADITHALAHLDHAIRLMGIDHVGLGTDFDGDGGVPGFASAAAALNFTMHLLRRRYTPADLAAIWGDNWLRAWQRALDKKAKYPQAVIA